jgi:soluble lytic murein transglycosylase-like protein
MKPIALTVFVAIILGANLHIANSDVIPLSYSPKVGYLVMANQIATAYHVPIPLLKAVVRCESSWNPNATHISKWEQSYGLGQINRLAHPDVSIKQAENPAFALTYVAKGLSTDPTAWSCYSQLKHVQLKSTINK